jgi:hypothetical protein
VVHLLEGAIEASLYISHHEGPWERVWDAFGLAVAGRTTPDIKQKDILIISGDCLGSYPEHENVDLLRLDWGCSSCLLIKPA